MLSEQYDAIVVGSGFGGAAAAYALVKAKYKVLLLERGDWPKRDQNDWSPREILINQRYKSTSPMLVKQYDDKDFKEKYPEEVVGGMSIFFGGACFRFREKDFAKWPITYSELEPYYSEAEQLLEVHGMPGADTMEPPRTQPYPFDTIPFKPPAERVARAAKALGFKPFPVPTSINFKNKARTVCILCNTCDGFPCKIEAKNDAVTGLIKRAQELDLKIVTGVIVKRLVEENGRITSLECLDKTTEKTFSLSAKVIVLSAGALQSPGLLLRSNLEKYEHHRFVGKYLMRHANAFVSYVFPYVTNPEEIFHKQICLTDFYEDLRSTMGTSVGNIQDNCMPAAEVIKFFAPKGLKNIASGLSRYIQGLLVIAEDDPEIRNEVTLSDQVDRHGLQLLKVEHHYNKNDLVRRDYLIKRARKILKKAGGLVSSVHKIDSFSHAVGTLRFGSSPKDSVLDKNCQFFGVRNLFVLDGSFMPSSAGLNPSLTIVANSLRVGDFIASHYQQI